MCSSSEPSSPRGGSWGLARRAQLTGPTSPSQAPGEEHPLQHSLAPPNCPHAFMSCCIFTPMVPAASGAGTVTPCLSYRQPKAPRGQAAGPKSPASRGPPSTILVFVSCGATGLSSISLFPSQASLFASRNPWRDKSSACQVPGSGTWDSAPEVTLAHWG